MWSPVRCREFSFAIRLVEGPSIRFTARSAPGSGSLIGRGAVSPTAAPAAPIIAATTSSRGSTFMPRRSYPQPTAMYTATATATAAPLRRLKPCLCGAVAPSATTLAEAPRSWQRPAAAQPRPLVPRCMCCDPRAPATQELQELSIGIPYCFACIPSRLVLSDHMQNSELY